MTLHTSATSQTQGADPIDVVEQVLINEQYAYERADDMELHFSVPGTWCDHQLWVAWRPGIDTLQVCLGIENKIPDRNRVQVTEMIALLNERLWLGHFDIWAEDGSVIYRAGLALPEGDSPSPSQIALHVAAAVEAGERFYPALNLLLWSGRTPREAVDVCLFDTVGEA